jgi:hypothetical protein
MEYHCREQSVGQKCSTTECPVLCVLNDLREASGSCDVCLRSASSNQDLEAPQRHSTGLTVKRGNHKSFPQLEKARPRSSVSVLKKREIERVDLTTVLYYISTSTRKVQVLEKYS